MSQPYDPDVRQRRDRMSAWTTVLVAACAATVVVAWPADGSEPQRSWYALVQIRAGLLAAWGAWAGTRVLRRGDGERSVPAIGWIATASLLTVPLDVAAWFTTRPLVPAPWAMPSGALVGLATFGAVGAASTVAGRVLRGSAPWLRRVVVAPVIGALPFAAPLLLRQPSWLPTAVPTAPGLGAALLLLAGCAAAALLTLDLGHLRQRLVRARSRVSGGQT